MTKDDKNSSVPSQNDLPAVDHTIQSPIHNQRVQEPTVNPRSLAATTQITNVDLIDPRGTSGGIIPCKPTDTVKEIDKNKQQLTLSTSPAQNKGELKVMQKAGGMERLQLV